MGQVDTASCRCIVEVQFPYYIIQTFGRSGSPASENMECKHTHRQQILGNPRSAAQKMQIINALGHRLEHGVQAHT